MKTQYKLFGWFLFAGFLALSAFTLYRTERFEPPIKSLGPTERKAAPYARFTAPDTLVTYREFNALRLTSLTVTREIYGMNDGVLTRFDLPSRSVSYDPAENPHRVRRMFDIPVLPPGTYEYHSTICWHTRLLRRDCLVSEPMTITGEK